MDEIKPIESKYFKDEHYSGFKCAICSSHYIGHFAYEEALQCSADDIKRKQDWGVPEYKKASEDFAKEGEK